VAGEDASKTEGPVDKSFSEIKRTLTRFGATAFGYAEQGNRVGVQFEINGLRVMMRMVLPEREKFARNSYGTRRPDTAIDRDHEQACRQRWRSLANGIKAKLALVDDGISTVEREFLADIMLPSGETVGDRISPDIHESIRVNVLPSIMPGMSSVVAIGAHADE